MFASGTNRSQQTDRTSFPPLFKGKKRMKEG